MEYEWYVDIFFLTSFLMDAAGIFAAAVCCSQPVKIVRTLLVCLAAVAAGILLLVFLPGYLLCRLLIHIVVNPLMIAAVFRPRQWGLFFRLLLSVYLVLFFAGGVQESILSVTGSTGGWQVPVCGLFALAVFLIYLKRQGTMRCVCAVDLWMRGKKVSVTAYCDSGNLLRNPADGKPVSILQREILEELGTAMRDTVQVPCRTISGDESVLEVVTLDKMDIYMRGTVREIKAPEIGLHAGELMRHPPVQMLLHGSYMG